MSADFSTELTAWGSKEEYLKILEFFHHYADERQAQYRTNRNCWYLDLWGDKIGEVSEDRLTRFVKDGVFSIGFSGPYGIINGPIVEVMDLFERLADVVPTCCFEGEISGFDNFGDQEIKVKLENGLLFKKTSWEDSESEWDEDGDEEDWDDGDADEESNTDSEWDTIYDPIKHQYRDFPKNFDPNDKVTVTVSLTDSNENTHQLVLASQNIERPTNFSCPPTLLMEADSVEKLIQTLTEYVEGDGDVLRKAEIAAFGERLKSELGNAAFTKLELTKTHDHNAPFFFGWLKSNVLGEEYNLKKMAKKAITCAEKNRQKNLESLEAYLNQFEPSFPWCEYTGWPEFCPSKQIRSSFDWHGLADTIEGFAQYICSKEKPREYAIEKVTIDYSTGTIEQTAKFMPRAPKKLS